MATSTLSFKRVSALPVIREGGAIYLHPDPDDNKHLNIACVSSDGAQTLTSFSREDILAIIREIEPFTTTVRTFTLPNVGDECNVILDDIIRINYVKTTNGGNEGYRVNLYAIGPDRTVGFRRDTIYDNTSAEGANSNALVLKESTGYVSDSLTYGSMRDVTRKIIVDYETNISWTIHVYGFGAGKIRFIIERYQESI